MDSEVTEHSSSSMAEDANPKEKYLMEERFLSTKSKSHLSTTTCTCTFTLDKFTCHLI